jgi:hypothetical protein
MIECSPIRQLTLIPASDPERSDWLGLTVFSGMLGVTLSGIFLTPVFFYVLQ